MLQPTVLTLDKEFYINFRDEIQELLKLSPLIWKKEIQDKCSDFTNLKCLILNLLLEGNGGYNFIIDNIAHQPQLAIDFMGILMRKLVEHLKINSEPKNDVFEESMILMSMFLLKMNDVLKKNWTSRLLRQTWDGLLIQHPLLLSEINNLKNKIKEELNSQLNSKITLKIHEFYNGCSGKQNLLNHFKDFPKTLTWLIYIDGVKQQGSHEKTLYDWEKREQHSLEKVNEAQCLAYQTMSESLTLDLIKKLHVIATKGVKNDSEKGLRPCMLRDSLTSSTFSVYTFLGLDSQNNLPTTLRWFTFRNIHKNNIWIKFEYFYQNNAQLDFEINSILNKYNNNIISENEPLNKLKFIAKCAADLNRLHPFCDGNTRLANIILNRELVKHGFTPTMMEDPNLMDIYSEEENVLNILRGMEHFNYFKKHGRYPSLKTLTEKCTIESSSTSKKNIKNETTEEIKRLCDLPALVSKTFFDMISTETNKLESNNLLFSNLKTYFPKPIAELIVEYSEEENPIHSLF